MRLLSVALAVLLLASPVLAQYEDPYVPETPTVAEAYPVEAYPTKAYPQPVEAVSAQDYPAKAYPEAVPLYGSKPVTASSRGPGGCSGPEECAAYCSEHQEECTKYGTVQVSAADYRQYAQPVGPSDFSPTMYVVNLLFERAKNKLDPAESAAKCSDPERLVDDVIANLKEQGAFDIKAACSKIGDQVTECKKRAEQGCAQLESHSPHFIVAGEKLGCDASQDDFKKLCIEQNLQAINKLSSEEHCAAQWGSYSKSNAAFCEQDIGVCDEAAFREQLKTKQESYCKQASPEGDTEYFDRCVSSFDYGRFWNSQKQNCDYRTQYCDRDTYVGACVSRLNADRERIAAESQKRCDQQSVDTYKHFQLTCAKFSATQTQCEERSQKACAFQEDAFAKCDALTETDVRADMLQQATRFCKSERLLSQANTKALAAIPEAAQLAITARSIKESLPEASQPFLDKGTQDVADATEGVDEAQTNKGLVYGLKWALGLAADNERKDADTLKKSSEKIAKSIDVLSGLVGQLSDETARSSLKEQIDALKARQAELDRLAETKQKRAHGILSFILGR